MYTIVGFGTLLTIVIPTQSCIEMLDKTIRNTITKLTDKRNQIMKEIAVGIKVFLILNFILSFHYIGYRRQL